MKSKAGGSLDKPQSRHAANSLATTNTDVQEPWALLDPALRKAYEAMRDNQPVVAESVLRTFLPTHPDDVNALKLMAEIAVRKGDFAAAESFLARCVELAPDFWAARYGYAFVLVSLSKLAPAKLQLEELLRREPQNADYCGLMAYALGQLGDYKRALAYHEAVLAVMPTHAKAWLAYANDLRACGRQAECIAAYRKVLEVAPHHTEAYWNLANLKTFRFAPAELSAMRTQLARSDIPAGARSFLHFSVAKAHEDASEYAQAFDHFRTGNALQHALVAYDAERTTKEFARLKEVFTAEFFAKRSGAGHPAKDPVFIVGLPRSGSTLVEQILSSHSAIEGTRELPYIQSICGPLDAGHLATLSSLPDATIEKMGREYLNQAAPFRHLGRQHFTDKMPSNFVYVPLIHLLLPNARIIDVRKAPLDACLANFKQIFSRAFAFSYNLSDLGRYYRDYVDLMDHYDRVLPGKIYRLSYERLVANAEPEIRCLLEYLDLPFERQCLRFYESDRPVRSASSEQVRMPLYSDAIGQWRHYDKWISPLKAALGPLLNADELGAPDRKR